MNIALIIAGGSGSRMGQDIPKQFLNVYDKPVLFYTLAGFQEHPLTLSKSYALTAGTMFFGLMLSNSISQN